MKFKKIYIIIILLVLIVTNANSHFIITNKSNPVNKLSKSEIRNIYLGNTITWKNNRKIQIVDYNSESELREDFSNSYLFLSPNKVSMIWLKVTLSGKVSPPKILYKVKDVIKFVSEYEDAIGYVDNIKDLTDDVKIIEVVDN